MCTFYFDNMPFEKDSLACVGVLFLQLFLYMFKLSFELEHTLSRWCSTRSYYVFFSESRVALPDGRLYDMAFMGRCFGVDVISFGFSVPGLGLAC